jgi:hypothetical protein
VRDDGALCVCVCVCVCVCMCVSGPMRAQLRMSHVRLCARVRVHTVSRHTVFVPHLSHSKASPRRRDQLTRSSLPAPHALNPTANQDI